MKKNWGIYLSFTLSILMTAAGTSQLSSNPTAPANLVIAGPILFLGTLAYYFAKKRGEGRAGIVGLIVELAAIIAVLYLTFARNDLAQSIAEDPFPALIIPVLVIVAYLIRVALNFRRAASQRSNHRQG